MRLPQFIYTTTFRWALTVTAVLAIFVAVLFGFMRDVCAGRETGRQQQPCS